METIKEQNNKDYLEFRGRCKELSEEACSQDPTLTLVRGQYFCPIWNVEEDHWWTTKPDGIINDPSKRQFPSKGSGIYIPFNGLVTCDQCGKEIPEKEASYESNYKFCSGRCHGRFVGVY